MKTLILALILIAFATPAKADFIDKLFAGAGMDSRTWSHKDWRCVEFQQWQGQIHNRKINGVKAPRANISVRFYFLEVAK